MNTNNEGSEKGTNVPAGRRPYVLGAVLLVIGAVLGWLGIELLMLGGSPYYIIAGLAIGAAGVLTGLRNRWGARLYALMLLGTLVWALWEVGLDMWALAPRLIAPAVLGLWFLMPWVRRALEANHPKNGQGRFETLAAWTVPAMIGCYLLVAIGALTHGRASTAAPAIEVNAPGVADPTDGDWRAFGNSQSGTRFSPLAEINPANVGRLEVAWTAPLGTGANGALATLEATPLKVRDTLYVCNGFNDVTALDADTGRQRWRYAAKVDPAYVYRGICRGVSYYPVPNATGECAERIYTATVDARLIALDSRSGRPCREFGANGTVDLMTGMGDIPKGYYYVTSPPQLVRGKLVVGGAVLDGQHVNEASGVIRAFDAVTGKLAWAWDMGRPGQAGEPGPGEHYTLGTANSWAPMSADEQLGLVYVPTGNGNPDYYGGQRTPEVLKYSSSVVAIDAETGQVRWAFQTAHNDLWDYDVASQPVLIDLPTPRGMAPALIQPTKRGELFVLDRRTGRPLVDTREMPVPQGQTVPGERLSPTQPFSLGMPSFRGPDLTERDMWGMTPIDQAYCRIMFKRARYEGTMTPPGFKWTLAMPGYTGGMDWGSVSYDPARKLLIFPSNRFVNYNRVITRKQADKMGLKPAAHGGVASIHAAVAQAGTPYGADISVFLSPYTYMPCQRPPYGTLNAVDMRTRKLVWSRPVGTARDMGPRGYATHLPLTIGAPFTGGALVTASGLTFIGATPDRGFRAFDSATGKQLWEGALPASAMATPMTYRSPSGRQFIVIAAGGAQGMPGPMSDTLVAFALPNE